MSDRPVAERLQVKGERRLAVIGASATLEKTVGVARARADLAKADVVLLFAPDRAGPRCKTARCAQEDAEQCDPLDRLSQAVIQARR
jgi:hypothetical protein